MKLNKMIDDLRREKELLERVITSLEKLQGTMTNGAALVKKQRGVKRRVEGWQELSRRIGVIGKEA